MMEPVRLDHRLGGLHWSSCDTVISGSDLLFLLINLIDLLTLNRFLLTNSSLPSDVRRTFFSR